MVEFSAMIVRRELPAPEGSPKGFLIGIGVCAANSPCRRWNSSRSRQGDESAAIRPFIAVGGPEP
jgi:hypothetical protein